MSFLFKSIFWLLVVGAFIPRDFQAHAATAPASLPGALTPSGAAASAPEAPLIDAGASVDRFCEGRREVCAAGEEAAVVARAAGRFAAARAARSLEAPAAPAHDRGERR